MKRISGGERRGDLSRGGDVSPPIPIMGLITLARKGKETKLRC